MDDVLQRMAEVARRVKALDEPLRPAAFAMMRDYILGGTAGSGTINADSKDGDSPTTTEGFFADRDLGKPSEAVMAIAAYLYGRFGSQPFEIAEVRTIADEVGLTVPERIDMTLKGARRSGKSLFRPAGKGRFAPTIHGEATLKAEYGVGKGRENRPEE